MVTIILHDCSLFTKSTTKQKLMNAKMFECLKNVRMISCTRKLRRLWYLLYCWSQLCPATPPDKVSCLVYSFESALNQHSMKKTKWLVAFATCIKTLKTVLLWSCFSHVNIIEMRTMSNSTQEAIIENSMYPAIVVITASIWARNWENVGLWSGLLCQHCCITIL